MSAGAYIAGWLLLGFELASCGAAATLLLRRLGPPRETSARILFGATLGLALLVFVQLVPLLFGALTRGTVLIVTVAVLGAAWRFGRPGSDGTAPPEPGPAGLAARAGARSVLAAARADPLAWGLAAVAALAVAGFVLAFLTLNRSTPISDVDGVDFHLPTVATWVRAGSLWTAADYVPGWSFGAYPNTGNLLQLAVVLPWHDEFLLRLIGPMLLALGALGVYAIARELGVGRPVSLTAGALAFASPDVRYAALGTAGTDNFLIVVFLAGCLALLRHSRTGARRELILAGLGLGLGFGTKWYGPPDVIVVIVGWTAARAAAGNWRLGGHLSRFARGAVLRDGAAVLGAAVLVGGVWLARNVALYGNPLFPAHLPGFDAPARDVGSDIYQTLALHLTEHRVTSAILPQWGRWLSWPSAVALAGALAVVARTVAHRRADRSTVVAVVALALLIVYLILPETLFYYRTSSGVVVDGIPTIRYALPGLVLCCAAGAFAASRGRRVALGAQLLAAAAILAAEMGNGTVTSTSPIGRGRILASAVAVGVVAAAALAARAMPLRLAVRRGAAGAALVALAFVLVAVGLRRQQTAYDSTWYSQRPAFAWLARHTGSGRRIALAGWSPVGRWAPIAAFGTRLTNEVVFLGRRDHHLLVDEPNQSALASALGGGHFDVLVAGDATATAWASRAGWSPVAGDGTVTALLPPGRAQPAR